MTHSKRILIVSDKSSEVHHQIGNGNDFEVLTERVGQRAYRTIKQMAPDMVIIDFETPGLEQSWLCAQLQERSPFEEIPVVVLTNSLDRDEREIAMDMLGHPFLSKETELSLLAEQIETRLVH